MSIFIHKNILLDLWRKIRSRKTGVVLYNVVDNFPNSDHSQSTFPINLSESAFNFKMIKIQALTYVGYHISTTVCNPAPKKWFRICDWRMGGDTANTSWLYYTYLNCEFSDDGTKIQQRSSDYGYCGYRRLGNASSNFVSEYPTAITKVIGYYEYC